MHELGVVIEVIKTIDRYVIENALTEVDKIVLQIGELSSMVPEYVEACYPAAVDGTKFEKTKLEIEVIPGNGLCENCKKVFNLMENKNTCPYCESTKWELLSGREFTIKEIVAY